MPINLFSYAISKHKIDLPDNYSEQIIEYGNNNIKDNGQTEANLHHTDLFRPLAQAFIEAGHTHIKDLGFDPDNQFIITQMWLNCFIQDDFLRIHTHPNSIYSGVFYIGDNLDYGTEFLKPTIGNQLELKTRTINEYTADSVTIEPDKNLLVIFPSFLQHRAITNKQKENRYTISFNCLPKTFGEKSKLNYFEMP